MEPAPDRVHVVSGDGVWIEEDAITQMDRVAALPRCMRAVGMPDLHPGPGIPIGAAFAFAGEIRPALVGADAGCGARLMAVRRLRAGGDALERRVAAEMDGPALPEVDPEALFDAVWQRGIAGISAVAGVPRSLAELAAAAHDSDAAHAGDDRDIPPCTDRDWLAAERAGAGRALGTIGGGNHFAEVSRVERIADQDAAAALGLVRGGGAVLVHSGSRGLGRVIAARWGTRELAESSDAAARYLGELAAACRYARANRLILAWRLLRALGEARPGKITGTIDVTHNTVTRERVDAATPWVHRKGCAPAHRDQATIVLGSRGTPSWVMLGSGRGDTLCSVAHGAGRRMTRAEARDKLRDRYRRTALRRTAAGGRVICDQAALLLEEHPDAYKPIEPVVEALVARGLARRVASLLPVITVKR